MIRALQMRVNTRTARYSKLVEGSDGEQAQNAELVDALRRLGRAAAADLSRDPRSANGEEPMNRRTSTPEPLGACGGGRYRVAGCRCAGAGPNRRNRTGSRPPGNRPPPRKSRPRRWPGWRPEGRCRPHRAKAEAIWSNLPAQASEDDVLVRLVETFALGDANAAAAVGDVFGAAEPAWWFPASRGLPSGALAAV